MIEGGKDDILLFSRNTGTEPKVIWWGVDVSNGSLATDYKNSHKHRTKDKSSVELFFIAPNILPVLDHKFAFYRLVIIIDMKEETVCTVQAPQGVVSISISTIGNRIAIMSVDCHQEIIHKRGVLEIDSNLKSAILHQNMGVIGTSSMFMVV